MRLKALVVEDDEASLNLVCEMLEESGIDARGQRSSRQAANLVDVEKFDGIYIDLTMPGLSGVELARRVRRSVLNATTPIIVISGRTDRDAMKEAFAAGVQVYLFKPVDRMKLTRLLNSTQGSLLRESLQRPPGAESSVVVRKP